MSVTVYPDINLLLDEILMRIRAVLGDNCVGLYLHGSLRWGDFDYKVSDIDLLAATATDLSQTEIAQLAEMHTLIDDKYVQWKNRVEVRYVPAYALQMYKTQPVTMAVNSPGEPFQLKEAAKEYLIVWYVIREKGLALFGPPANTIIAPMSSKEFIEAIREHAEVWHELVKQTRNSRPYQSYAILTLCRALYAATHGQHTTKKQAALWAQKQLPQWSGLIRHALIWRKRKRPLIFNSRTYPQTVEFVEYVIGEIAKI